MCISGKMCSECKYMYIQINLGECTEKPYGVRD